MNQVHDNAVPEEIRQALLSKGALRAAINYGNPVLAQKSASGEPAGVSVALARALAQRLSVPLEIVPFIAAGKVAAEASNDVWDVAFLAIDPLRAQTIIFTDPYVVIDGTYLVHDGGPFSALDDLDAEGVRISVGKGAAYDLYLSRELKRAELVRVETSSGAVEAFLDGQADAAAGVRQPLEQAARDNTGLRVIDGAFTSIRQAMATPRKNQPAYAYLQAFVEEMKASGFVARALQESGQADASVAPPAGARNTRR